MLAAVATIRLRGAKPERGVSGRIQRIRETTRISQRRWRESPEGGKSGAGRRALARRGFWRMCGAMGGGSAQSGREGD